MALPSVKEWSHPPMTININININVLIKTELFLSKGKTGTKNGAEIEGKAI